MGERGVIFGIFVLDIVYIWVREFFVVGSVVLGIVRCFVVFLVSIYKVLVIRFYVFVRI